MIKLGASRTTGATRLLTGILLGAMLTLPIGALAHGRLASGADPSNVRHVRIHIVGAFPCQEDQLLVPRGDFDGRAWSGGWSCVARDNLR